MSAIHNHSDYSSAVAYEHPYDWHQRKRKEYYTKAIAEVLGYTSDDEYVQFFFKLSRIPVD